MSDPTFTPDEVQQILARLRAGESVPGWGYITTPAGMGVENDNDVWVDAGESLHYDISPTRRQGYSLDGFPTTPVFNPGEGYRRSVKYVEPLALAAFGTALGMGLNGAFGAGGASGAGAGTTAGSGSTLGSLGSVTQVGTPLAELGATGGLSTSAAGALPSMGAAGATPSLLSQAGNALSSATDWMKANPTAGRLLMSGATSLLSASGGSGGSSGGYRDSGYRPTITRGQWNPNPQAQQMPMQRTLLNLPTTGNQNSGLWRYGLLGG